MYYIHETGFSYLLYPKKYKTIEHMLNFKNDVDMLHYYLNTGVPFSYDMPEPVYVSQAMIERYGIDNLVMNLQRKFKYDFDIVVVKVPQEYLQMHPTFPKDENTLDYQSKYRTLPMMVKEKFNGINREMISPNFVESVYLRYPDCRRIINYNWSPVSKNTEGMLNLGIQNRNLSLSGDIVNIFNYDLKSKIMQQEGLTTTDCVRKSREDENFANKYRAPQELVDYVKAKYGMYERRIPCPMTKERIKTLLDIARKSDLTKESQDFVGAK